MTGISMETIAPAGGNAWKPEVGEKVKGTVVYVGTFVRKSEYTDLNESVLRVDIDTGEGDPVNVYATMNTNSDSPEDGWSKRDAKAIAAAVRAAGATSLDVGGTLAVKRIDDVTTSRGPAKAFQAQYQPPAAPAVAPDDTNDGATDDLF